MCENDYNLAFGDWNSETLDLDDQIRSNNDDIDVVLAAVARATMDFVKANPAARIFEKGSTPTRTRKYQIEISFKRGVYCAWLWRWTY